MNTEEELVDAASAANSAIDKADRPAVSWLAVIGSESFAITTASEAADVVCCE